MRLIVGRQMEFGRNEGNEALKSHLLNPRNVGELKDADFIISHTNSVCGDSIKLYVRVEGRILKEIKYKVFGCSTTVAVSSLWSEFIKNQDIIELMEKEIYPIQRCELDETRKHAFDLVFEAMTKLYKEVKEKN
ncbi:MAG: iron-sulfur cluster assembly scaffold protein [Planctomycetota bacterium]